MKSGGVIKNRLIFIRVSLLAFVAIFFNCMSKDSLSSSTRDTFLRRFWAYNKKFEEYKCGEYATLVNVISNVYEGKVGDSNAPLAFFVNVSSWKQVTLSESCREGVKVLSET